MKLYQIIRENVDENIKEIQKYYKPAGGDIVNVTKDSTGYHIVDDTVGVLSANLSEKAKELPNLPIESCKNLKLVRIKNITSLKNLPQKINGTLILQHLQSLETLKSDRTIDVSTVQLTNNFDELTSLDGLPSSVTTLNIYSINAPKFQDDIRNYPHIRTLIIDDSGLELIGGKLIDLILNQNIKLEAYQQVSPGSLTGLIMKYRQKGPKSILGFIDEFNKGPFASALPKISL